MRLSAIVTIASCFLAVALWIYYQSAVVLPRESREALAVCVDAVEAKYKENWDLACRKGYESCVDEGYGETRCRTEWPRDEETGKCSVSTETGARLDALRKESIDDCVQLHSQF